jgi:hypothetical protein
MGHSAAKEANMLTLNNTQFAFAQTFCFNSAKCLVDRNVQSPNYFSHKVVLNKKAILANAKSKIGHVPTYIAAYVAQMYYNANQNTQFAYLYAYSIKITAKSVIISYYNY